MCYHKSKVQKFEALMGHYSASFRNINEDLEPIHARFEILMRKDGRLNSLAVTETDQIHNLLALYSQKNALPSTLTKQELSELKWCLKTLSSFREDGIYRYHENGFDYLPSPIVTTGDPDNFKLFNWGFVPFYMTDKDKAMMLRTQTLNCISEEMYEKPSFRDAAKNEQRCLIPVTGFFEWRWLDEAGTVKIPYYVTFRDQQVRSMAGLYSRWKNSETGEYYYSYTLLTTKANTILDYVHNNKKRMPVFIAPEDEKSWLSKGLTKAQVLDLCQPYQDNAMRAYTISKLLTTKNVITNTPEVIVPFNYNVAIQEANEYLQTGDKKKALEVFKNSVGAEKIKVEDLEHAATQEILAELAM
jgi:putative SOS response-associated peptidase YedK